MIALPDNQRELETPDQIREAIRDIEELMKQSGEMEVALEARVRAALPVGVHAYEGVILEDKEAQQKITWHMRVIRDNLIVRLYYLDHKLEVVK